MTEQVRESPLFVQSARWLQRGIPAVSWRQAPPTAVSRSVTCKRCGWSRVSSGSVRNLLHFILTSATCSVTSLRGNESLTRQSDSEACGDGKEGKLAFKVKAKTRRLPNKLPRLVQIFFDHFEYLLLNLVVGVLCFWIGRIMFRSKSPKIIATSTFIWFISHVADMEPLTIFTGCYSIFGLANLIFIFSF